MSDMMVLQTCKARKLANRYEAKVRGAEGLQTIEARKGEVDLTSYQRR